MNVPNVARRVVLTVLFFVALCVVDVTRAAEEPSPDGKKFTGDELTKFYLQKIIDKAEDDPPALSHQRDLLQALRSLIERLDRRAEQRPKAMPEEPVKESPKELPKESESEVTKPDHEPIASDDETLVANRRPTLESFALVVLGLDLAIEGLEIMKLKVIQIAQRQAS